MKKVDALESIDKAWNDAGMKLGDKIMSISSDYYSAGLDLSTTAAHIRATPAELDFLLTLSELDDDILDELSEVNPPKTTWMMIANGSEEEVATALRALKERRSEGGLKGADESMTRYVYMSMMDVMGPTKEQLVADLPGDVLFHALKKGEGFNALKEKDAKFLKSVAGQKKRGKTLSEKQIAWLMNILDDLANQEVIIRGSIDGDTDICDRILDALGR